jgi:peptidoglycan/LPS O-acetylase OafA/YrhL
MTRPARTPMSFTKSGPRLDSLTGLRFFAAFAVLLDHVDGVRNSGYARIPWIYPESLYGAHGVAFFFVLSGFVLTWSWREGDRTGPFYWRRFARIYPAHLAATFIAVPIFYGYSHDLQPGWKGIFLSLALLQAWFFHLHPMFPGNPVSWTLSCEMFFYALFPFVVRPLIRRSSEVVMGVIAASLATMFVVSSLGYHFLSASDAGGVVRLPAYTFGQFLIGICLALLLRRGYRCRVPLSAGIVALFGWIIFYYEAVPRLGGAWVTWEPSLDELLLPIFCACIIGAAAQREIERKRSVLRTRTLVTLGVWSYSFYLLHKTIIRLPTIAYGDHPHTNDNLFVVIGLTTCAVIASGLMYKLIEHPAERWLRTVGARFEARRDATAQSRLAQPTAHDLDQPVAAGVTSDGRSGGP